MPVGTGRGRVAICFPPCASLFFLTISASDFFFQARYALRPAVAGVALLRSGPADQGDVSAGADPDAL